MGESEPIPNGAPDGALYLYRFGAAEFDESRFELRVGGLPVDLERRPLEVLRMLLRHAGEVVTREELLETVWEGRITVDNVLANAVAKLRKALGEAGAGLIVTQARVGYRLDGKVERVATGRRLVSRLDLKVDKAVPGRPNFRLARQLSGSGGSEVWLARHEKTGERRVYKFSPGGERLAALKREATLSRLLRETLGERADIARVIDWNFETEPFFLECEYGGRSLPAWAEEDGKLAALPRDARLDLARRVIEAVAAAHSVGVLHKDLKPANILIEENGEGGRRLRLTDFGSGRLMEPGRLDELGVTPLGLTRTLDSSSDSSFGTPHYIAPEIIAGAAATVQSDVYALGVLLYQILTGDLKKPLTTGWEEDVPDPLLREDIADATAGDPARRLASASELADRLRRLEERRAERARLAEAETCARAAQAALQRAQARRPWVVGTVAVLALGVAASAGLFLQARDARHAAEEQAARAEATAAFLRDIMINADPRQPGAGHSATLRDALSRAADSIEARFAADPVMEATIRETAGEIYTGLQDFTTAAEHRRRAAALFETMLGADHPRTLEARYRLGEALTNASLYAEAGEVLDAADQHAGARREQNDAVALAAARARGRFHLLQAQIEPATAYYEEALERLSRLQPDDARARHGLSLDLAQAYVRIGRQDEAVAILEALQDDARFADAGVSDARRATATLHYGAALLYAGRLEDAEPVLGEAIPALIDAFGPDSTQVAEGKSVLGNIYAASGRWAEAAPLIADVRETTCAAQGPEHLTCVMAGGNEGVILVQLGQAEEAVPKLVAARDVFERMMGPGTPGVQVMNYYLAQGLLDLGDGERAAAIVYGLDPAQLAAGSPGEEWPARVEALKGWAMLIDGRREEGAALLQTAVAEMERQSMQDWIVEPFRRALAAVDH
ncbi:protein kinase domain-containing protein [Amphiplicatus metriothermophilus]|uniref:Serine/threonine protein kinase n=1 Tax=Amphiplicatus metriothermophilus TaxID=1519374 RepID=A0A239PLT7_9PROT|nr:winged helix-turn-helix domain-containing protein [Amphiplicatus metriothermophilus]MBB5517351.1 non-specific serine/threonine protein kinase [Amphiplicatus metriothermophilus]SNT68313.1 serine/threonine protein kinase [Amphiplicatus metriothermophilus]